MECPKIKKKKSPEEARKAYQSWYKRNKAYKHAIKLAEKDDKGPLKFITRSHAIESGLRKFFTGRECSQHHIAERFVSSGGCCECARLNLMNRRALKRAEEDQETE